MNQPQSYMDMHAGSHLSSGPSYSHPAPSAPMPHYPQYSQQPVMAPGSGHYGHPQSYGSYSYANGVQSPQSATGPVGPQVQSQAIQLPAMMPNPNSQHSYVPANATPTQGYANSQPFDTTGQIAPPGMKPRVTATLWEDEGSLCFQVEAKGVCVARREDNHFINGTKLLNVAGMTRGRRDGILKSEKTRHVVKIGPMHLKGVWIPFERALDFANKEKITDLLYPLFVHNIGGLLYNPENAPRTNAVVNATTERRRLDSVDSSRPAQGSQAPPLHHHHSMQGPVGGQAPPTPHSIAPNPGAGRPGIDRAHTFPTPPTSASSVMAMGSQGSSYEWGGQHLPSSVPGSQPLSIDTMNARSMPTTPATTPPGTSNQVLQSYQTQHSYDNKHYYNSTPGSQGGYQHHPDPGRYAQTMPTSTYGKTEMGPPTVPTGPNSGPESHEQKPEPYAQVPSQAHGEHDGPDHHEGGYMHANTGAYAANRGQFAYNPASDHPHLSPEMTGSPHQSGSGRGTPRTMPPGPPQWPQDFQTPPRPAPTGSGYNVMGNSSSSNAPSSTGNYGSSTYSNAPSMASGKRAREDEDDRPNSRDYDGSYAAKRHKNARQDTFGMPLSAAPHMQAIKTGGQR